MLELDFGSFSRPAMGCSKSRPFPRESLFENLSERRKRCVSRHHADRKFRQDRAKFMNSALAFIRKRSILMEQLRGVAQSG